MYFQSRFSAFAPSGENPTNELYLCQSGWESCNPGHSCIGLIRDHYLLHFVASGKGSWHNGGKVHDLGAGDAFLICPGEDTSYFADREDPWEYCWFGIKGDKALDVLGLAGLSQNQRIFRFRDLSLIDSIIKMHNSVEKSANPYLTGTGHVMLILGEMAEMACNDVRRISGRDYARSAVNFIEYNYSRDININSLAEMVAVDRSHFYRIFKKETGMSPKDYLINCRVRNARRLLLDSQLSVSEVAAAVGYKDPVNFIKIFKARTGTTPGSFRNGVI